MDLGHKEMLSAWIRGAAETLREKQAVSDLSSLKACPPFQTLTMPSEACLDSTDQLL